MAENIYSCFHYHKKCQEDRQAIEELAPKIMEAAGNAAWGNVGDIKYTARTDVPNGGAWCDGATYAKEDYPDVYKLLTDGKLVSVDMATFNSSVNLNGSCGFFGLDDTGFKVPLLKDVYLKAGQEADEFGAESLPNITGELATSVPANYEKTQKGAVQVQAFGTSSSLGMSAGSAINHTAGSVYGFALNASRSSSTYQNGAKVNPDHVKYRAYIVLYTAEKELSIVDWTNQLQSKTDASINQIEAKTDDGVSTLNNLANTYSKEIGYLNGVTSNIQTQLNGKQASGSYIKFPKYNSGVNITPPTSSAKYTCPYDLLYVACIQHSGSNAFLELYVDNSASGIGFHNSDSYSPLKDSVTAFLKKGQVIYWSGTIKTTFVSRVYPLS